jgi:PAS domain S-box-containing protein
VTSGIASHAKSLGDFPLDPDQGKAWLWSGDGARLIWQSERAASALELAAHDVAQVSHGGALQGFAQELTSLQPDRQPIRVTLLPLNAGRTSGMFTCLCRHVPLADGSGFGLLTVDIGARPRLTRAAEETTEAAAAPVTPPVKAAVSAAPPPTAAAAPLMMDVAQMEVAQPDVPQPEVPRGPIDLRPAAAELRRVDVPTDEAMVSQPKAKDPPASSRPGWAKAPAGTRRPMRFVWQTDADGQFAHVSRELGEAVGTERALILGKRLEDVAAEIGVLDAEEAVVGLSGADTFSARPMLWPTFGGMAVPIELSGMPVRENGAFAGFRGFGIARLDEAQERSAMPMVDLPAASAPDPSLPTPLAANASQLLNDNARAEAEVPQTEASATADALLSPSERNAFREIARALGGRTAEPDAALDGLPNRPHRMPEWIAKRHQAMRASELPARAEMTSPEKPLPTAELAFVSPTSAENVVLRQARDGDTSGQIALIDKLPLALLVMQDGQAMHANPAFLRFAGYTDLPAFFAAGGAASIFTTPPADLIEREARTIIVRRGDGVSLSTLSQVMALTWADRPATLLSFLPGIAPPAPPERPPTELTAARAELDELRFVLDTAVDGVLSLDAQGRIIAANRSAEALFGFDRNEIVGEPLTVLLEPESHAAALDYLDGLKVDGVATIMNDGRDVIGRERHGGRIPLFMTLGRLGGATADARYCAVLRDVTIWKKSEAELTAARRQAEDANANKSDFLARISHEIRTPMNAIIGFADVMRSETFGPLSNDRYKGYANDIHASGIHVVSLVNDLLDISKIAAGKLDLTFGSVDLNQAVAESVSMIQPQANAGSVIVRTQLAQALPPVVADQRSIRQIMLNLLSNAAKFTEPGGQVVVTTVLTEKGEAAIRVRDTGIGMNVEEIRKALEPFRQIPGPKAQGGTGLGLPLTKALAEANRAAFVITSEPGKGTLAEIVFPATRVLAE